jgi:hypothetical protein
VATTGADGGNDCAESLNPCATLAHAISEADSGDVIQIAAGTYTEAGLVVNKNLTFLGAGADSTIIQAHGAPDTATQRVFTVNGGLTATFQGLTIRHGKLDHSTDGGGIYNNSATLVLFDVTLTANTAANGGGLYNNGGTVTITNSRLSNNKATNIAGGALANWQGTVVIASSTLSGNNASQYEILFVRMGQGGAIYSYGESSVLEIADSTINANRSYGDGGALMASQTVLSITNSTISGNGASSSGGGIYLSGLTTTASLEHVTISDNQAAIADSGAGGGVRTEGAITVKNSIVIGNRASYGWAKDDCSGPITSQGYNVFGVGTGCPATHADDQTAFHPKLASLADNGGPTQTHGLLAGNPALDLIPPGVNGCGTTYSVDQRGVARPAGANCDAGAFEGSVLPGQRYVALGGSDAANTCANAGAPCATLAHALTQASHSDQINLAAGTYTVAGLTVSKHVSMVGTGAAQTILQAHAAPNTATTRVLTIETGTFVELRNLTVRHGQVPGAFDDGGGIYNRGNLTLRGVAVQGSSAGSEGGGLFNDAHGNLLIEDSLVSGNTAPQGAGLHSAGGQAQIRRSTFSGNISGGGIDQNMGTLLVEDSTISGNTNFGIAVGGGTALIRTSTIHGNSQYGGVSVGLWALVEIINSTISGNSARGGGGGGVVNSSDHLTIINTTITNNTAYEPMSQIADGGGILNWGTVVLRNSIVAGNSGESAPEGADCYGSIFNLGITSQGYNLVGSGTGCPADGTGDQESANPLLDPLADNGGETLTHAVQAASPALDQIPPGVNGCGSAVLTDQRGYGRPANEACEVGAYEAAGPLPVRVYLPLAVRAP